jgi:hypothetical protein
MAGIVIPFSVGAAEEDDYLKAIEVETEKIGKSAPISTKEDGVAADTDSVVAVTGAGFSAGMSHEQLEGELKEKYAGTHLFYNKLPRSFQEEIYQDYLQGASIEEVRDKIMNRFLKR